MVGKSALSSVRLRERSRASAAHRRRRRSLAGSRGFSCAGEARLLGFAAGAGLPSAGFGGKRALFSVPPTIQRVFSWVPREWAEMHGAKRAWAAEGGDGLTNELFYIN